MAYLGIDIGTQSLKAVVTGEDLRPVGWGSVPYQPVHPRPGWAEQDPGLWLTALRPAIAQALDVAGLTSVDVRAVAVCGQLDGCIGVDRDGAALGPAIIWMDRRAEVDGIDPVLVRDRAGLVCDGTHMAAKIRWRQRHDPNASMVVMWHQPVTFVVEALCGRRVIDRGLASTTMLYGLDARGWDSDLLEVFGIDPAELPELADAADVAGALNARGAELTGLPLGTLLAVGTGDDFSNPLGCGISRPGTVSVTLGTAEAVAALAEEPLIDQEMLVETHAFPGGLFHIGNPGWLSGGAVNWFASTFSVDGAAEVSRLAETAPPGCDGLTFLPALSGAMTPRWIASARGAFYGMTPAHGKAHFARAVLEGTAFAMRDIIDRLAAMGVATGSIRIVGGGARSAVWTQMRADLTGRPAEALVSDDASAIGAAVLAATAAGALPDCVSASEALALPLRQIEPNPANREAYEDAYQRYRALFAALEPMY
jgi:xylulokinase